MAPCYCFSVLFLGVSNLIFFTLFGAIKSFSFLLVHEDLHFVPLKDPHHLVSNPWLMNIGYLSSDIYLLNLRFKTIRPFIVYAFLSHRSQKKKQILYFKSWFSFNFVVIVFVFAIRFVVFWKFSVSFSYFSFFCLTYLWSSKKQDSYCSSQHKKTVINFACNSILH